MDLVKENVSKRIDSILQSKGTPEQTSIRILLELIPYNKESEMEMSVWFHFIMADIHHRQQEDEGVLEGVQRIMTELHQGGILKDSINLDIETERLYALVDGLALHAILNPKRLQKEKIKQVLVNHMNTLFKQPIEETDI
ncbi:hypothetical protein BA724_12265 [Domibacillus iocasae]|uniref:BetI-type transcriptional repressor C-terminal domain-containing protein n=2 Tax=Domibacillus iocasae TaxID=1714016 RepID=A0A1E7DLA4_9BACI|nr:hypothetical protein BA724_12265 [Domibacillus iocasae]